MTSDVAAGVFTGSNISEAWRATVLGVDRASDQKLFHTVTRVTDPAANEDKFIRDSITSLLARRNRPTVETVANTIFPAAMTSRCRNMDELAQRYRALYPTIRKFPNNNHGTYFGRMVSYPGPTDGKDQLTALVARLRNQLTTHSNMSTPYEMTIESPADDEDISTTDPGGGLGVAHTHAAGEGRVRGFPCMSLLSFQTDAQHLHAFAHYRYEYLIEKGYGNYLGIARLQKFIAEELGLGVGILTISTGRAHVDVSRTLVADYVAQTSLLAD